MLLLLEHKKGIRNYKKTVCFRIQRHLFYVIVNPKFTEDNSIQFLMNSLGWCCHLFANVIFIYFI